MAWSSAWAAARRPRSPSSCWPRAGSRIVGVPTSERTAQLARNLGLALATLDEHPQLDLVIDGADQVERGTLNLVKGLGGALLREKIVASAARRMIVIVDDSKLVDRLGGHTPLPVEIVAYGWRSTVSRLERIGLHPTLRGGTEHPLVTDGGNHIADCAIDVIDDPTRPRGETFQPRRRHRDPDCSSASPRASSWRVPAAWR